MVCGRRGQTIRVRNLGINHRSWVRLTHLLAFYPTLRSCHCLPVPSGRLRRAAAIDAAIAEIERSESSGRAHAPPARTTRYRYHLRSHRPRQIRRRRRLISPHLKSTAAQSRKGFALFAPPWKFASGRGCKRLTRLLLWWWMRFCEASVLHARCNWRSPKDLTIKSDKRSHGEGVEPPRKKEM
jgi:hypothetical protein